MSQQGPEFDRARKLRSWAIAVGLLAFVILIFVVTYVRLAGNVSTRPL